LLAETPARDRARAVGIWGAAAATSALLGPTLGGLLVELGGWRAPFAINVPIGGAILLSLFLLVPRRPPSGGRLPDAIGVALVAAAVGSLVIALTEAGEWGWQDPRILVAAATGAIGTIVAVRRSRRTKAPVIDLGLMAERRFAIANAVSLVFAFAVFAWLLAGPLFAARVWDYDALTAALSVAPGAVTAALASMVAGRLRSRARGWAVVAGTVAFAATSIALAATLGDSPQFLLIWLPAGVLSGLAIGAVLASLSATVAYSVPAERFAGGAGLNMTARQLGGSFGVALLAALVGAGGGEAAADFTAVWLIGAAASLVACVGGVALVRIGARDPAGA
jgi:MFS family permease